MKYTAITTTKMETSKGYPWLTDGRLSKNRRRDLEVDSTPIRKWGCRFCCTFIHSYAGKGILHFHFKRHSTATGDQQQVGSLITDHCLCINIIQLFGAIHLLSKTVEDEKGPENYLKIVQENSLVRPVKENIPICLMIWFQEPGVPSSLSFS